MTSPRSIALALALLDALSEGDTEAARACIKQATADPGYSEAIDELARGMLRAPLWCAWARVLSDAVTMRLSIDGWPLDVTWWRKRWPVGERYPWDGRRTPTVRRCLEQQWVDVGMRRLRGRSLDVVAFDEAQDFTLSDAPEWNPGSPTRFRVDAVAEDEADTLSRVLERITVPQTVREIRQAVDDDAVFAPRDARTVTEATSETVTLDMEPGRVSCHGCPHRTVDDDGITWCMHEGQSAPPEIRSDDTMLAHICPLSGRATGPVLTVAHEDYEEPRDFRIEGDVLHVGPGDPCTIVVNGYTAEHPDVCVTTMAVDLPAEAEATSMEIRHLSTFARVVIGVDDVAPQQLEAMQFVPYDIGFRVSGPATPEARAWRESINSALRERDDAREAEQARQMMRDGPSVAELARRLGQMQAERETSLPPDEDCPHYTHLGPYPGCDCDWCEDKRRRGIVPAY